MSERQELRAQMKKSLTDLSIRIENLEESLRQIRDLHLIDNLSLEDCFFTAREIAIKAVGDVDEDDDINENKHDA